MYLKHGRIYFVNLSHRDLTEENTQLIYAWFNGTLFNSSHEFCTLLFSLVLFMFPYLSQKSLSNILRKLYGNQKNYKDKMLNVRVNKAKWVRKHLMSLFHNYGFEHHIGSA